MKTGRLILLFTLMCFTVMTYCAGNIFAANSDSCVVSVKCDIWQPQSVTDLTAQQTSSEGQITLAWTSPDENKNSAITTKQPVSGYRIRYATFSVVSLSSDTTAWWDNATYQIEQAFANEPGTKEGLLINNLNPGKTYYFAIRSYDDSSNWSDYDVGAYTVQASTKASHIYPPAAVTDLQADGSRETVDGSIRLTWTAPTQDPTSGGAVSYYLLGYNLIPASMLGNGEFWWNLSTTQKVIITSVSNPGNISTYQLINLLPGVTYYFGLKSVDAMGNVSSVDTKTALITSQAYSYAQVDVTPPAVIANLSADGRWETVNGQQESAIRLTWTNPATPDYAGVMIRVSTITYPGTRNDGVLLALSTGTMFNHINLVPQTNYYYSVFSFDYNGNYSAAVSTSAIALADTIPPAAVTDLKAEGRREMGEGNIILTWTGPGDDGSTGILSGKFRIAYSTMTNDGLQMTDYKIEITTTVNPLSVISYSLFNLVPGTTYYFRLWTSDESQNWSGMSNLVSAPATDLVPAAPQGVSIRKLGSNKLYLSWADNKETDLAGYKIYRSSGVSAALASKTYLTTILPSQPYYTDTNLVSSVTYYYQITTIDKTGNESLPTIEVAGLVMSLAQGGTISDGFNGYETYYRVVANFEFGENWDGGSVDTINYREGTQARKLASTNANPVISELSITANLNNMFTDSDYVQFWLNIDSITNVGYIKLGLSNDGSFSNYYEHLVNPVGLVSGWNFIKIRRSEFAKYGSADWTATMNKLRLAVNSASGTVVNVTFDDWRIVSALNTTGGQWQENSGLWTINDVNGNKIYNQQSNTVALNLVQGKKYKNFTYTTKCRASSATTFSGINSTATISEFGLIFRAEDDTRGYKFVVTGTTVTISTLTGTVLASSVVAELARLQPNNWFYLAVSCDGSIKRGYLSTDGTGYILVAEDTTNTEYSDGHIGLLTNNGTASFDEISIINNPVNLTAIGGDKQVTLTWQIDNAIGISGYNIYRSSNINTVYSTKVGSVTATTVLDSGLVNNVTYYYAVSSIDTTGDESELTGIVSVYPYKIEIIVPDSIAGKVTQADGKPLTGIIVEAVLNDTVIKTAGTFTDGTFSFAGLVNLTTYTIRATYWRDDQGSAAFKEVRCPNSEINFTLEIRYQLGTITGQLSGYRPMQSITELARKMAIKRLGDSEIRQAMLAPGNGIGFVELYRAGRLIVKVPVDTDGKYEIPNLLPGRYTLKAYNGATYSDPQRVEVFEGSNQTTNFVFMLDIMESKVFCAPNPVRGSNATMQYTCYLPEHETEIFVYNIAGELVKIIRDSDIDRSMFPICRYEWNLCNDYGEKVAAGIYLYIVKITNRVIPGDTKSVKKKLAIIR